MSGTSGTVAIVDAYDSANRLADAFAAQGHRCVRVQSVPEMPPLYRAEADLSRYAENIVHDGEFAPTVRALGRHGPLAVIAGSEMGVELADRLGDALGLAGNGTGKSYVRRTKDAQIDAVRAAGLPVPDQLLVTGAEQLAAWHRRRGGTIVVKPIRSARNDGVSFCDTEAESVAAYERILHARNVFDISNEGVVAQEYLNGTEFVVNTVSCEGRHRATDIWRYTKIHLNGVRDRNNGVLTLPTADPRREPLLRYAFAVLDALEIRFGPAHLEIMLTEDGPRLVELGARLCGSDVAEYAVLATGESQVDRTVQACVDPRGFLAEVDRPYRLAHHAAMAFLASPVEGVLRGYPLLDQVRALASYRGYSMKIKPGMMLRRTVDDTGEPMVIGLVHPDAATLEKDFATVCYLDGFGFYDIDPGH